MGQLKPKTIQLKEPKRCSCGEIMVRWHSQGPWICPRCIYRLTTTQQQEDE
jgi:hypothetical protein